MMHNNHHGNCQNNCHHKDLSIHLYKSLYIPGIHLYK